MFARPALVDHIRPAPFAAAIVTITTITTGTGITGSGVRTRAQT